MLQEKLKQKKFQKRLFLDFNFNPQIYKIFLKKITPHPNPHPAGGERGLEVTSLLLQGKKL
jgi:hypothetical protein